MLPQAKKYLQDRKQPKLKQLRAQKDLKRKHAITKLLEESVLPIEFGECQGILIIDGKVIFSGSLSEFSLIKGKIKGVVK